MARCTRCLVAGWWKWRDDEFKTEWKFQNLLTFRCDQHLRSPNEATWNIKIITIHDQQFLDAHNNKTTWESSWSTENHHNCHIEIQLSHRKSKILSHSCYCWYIFCDRRGSSNQNSHSITFIVPTTFRVTSIWWSDEPQRSKSHSTNHKQWKSLTDSRERATAAKIIFER